jgi:hypothetical protein
MAVVFMVGKKGDAYVKPRHQFDGDAGIFRRDEIAEAQGFDGSRGKIAQIAQGRPDYI